MPKKFNKKDRKNLLRILKESDSYFYSIRDCCKKAKIGKSTFYRWLKQDLEFKRKADEIIELRKFSPLKLIRKVKGGDVKASIEFLERYGKHR